ncbi:MAG: hypothetical protein ACE5HV_08455 [Acidobacteriota bacterium]
MSATPSRPRSAGTSCKSPGRRRSSQPFFRSQRAVPVPHRAEFTGTFAFAIKGASKSLLYIPDIDKWERWDHRIEDEIAAVEQALLDGTFFENDEVPGRDISLIPHLFIEAGPRSRSGSPSRSKTCPSDATGSKR